MEKKVVPHSNFRMIRLCVLICDVITAMHMLLIVSIVPKL